MSPSDTAPADDLDPYVGAIGSTSPQAIQTSEQDKERRRRFNVTSDTALDYFSEPTRFQQSPHTGTGDLGIQNYAKEAGDQYEDLIRRRAPEFADQVPQARQKFEAQLFAAQQKAKLDYWRDQYANADETTMGTIRRLAIPGAARVTRIEFEKNAKAADAAIQSGTANEDAYRELAAYNRLAQLSEDHPFKEAIFSLPSIVGEYAAGGKALGALGKITPGLGWLAPEAAAPTSLLGKGAVALGRGIGLTATVPGPAIEAARQSAMKEGGSLLDLKNLGPALAHETLQNAVFGSLSEIANLPGGSFTNRLQRIAAKTGIGIAEQQAIDVLAKAVHLQTRYGLMQDILEGKSGDALKNLGVQALTFSALSALHSGDPEAVQKRQMEVLQEHLKKMAGRGVPANEAGANLTPAIELLVDGFNRHPDATPEQLKEMAKQGLGPGPVRDFAVALANEMPEKPTPASETPPGVPAGPAVGPGGQLSVSSPVQEVGEPQTPRQRADALEAQHLDLLGKLQDAQRREAALKDDVSKGLNKGQDLQAATFQRRSLERSIKQTELDLEKTRGELYPTAKPAAAPQAPETPLGPEVPPQAPQAATTPAQAPEATPGAAVTHDQPFDEHHPLWAKETPEQKTYRLLTTSKKFPDVGNTAKFREGGNAPFEAVSDVDGMGKLSREEGDRVLRAKIDSLREAGLEPYHGGQDEFLTKADTREELQAKLEDARARLKAKTGADFSYGIAEGGKPADADAALREAKEAKKTEAPEQAKPPLARRKRVQQLLDAAAKNEPLQDLLRKNRSGQPVDEEEVIRAAGLTPRERHVLEQRSLARAYEDIGHDPQVNLTRQRVQQIEEEALAKFGQERSLEETGLSRAEQKANMLDRLAAGEQIEPGQLSFTKEEADAVKKDAARREASLTDSLKELEAIRADYEAEGGSKDHPLPPERQAEYDRRVAAVLANEPGVNGSPKKQLRSAQRAYREEVEDAGERGLPAERHEFWKQHISELAGRARAEDEGTPGTFAEATGQPTKRGQRGQPSSVRRGGRQRPAEGGEGSEAAAAGAAAPAEPGQAAGPAVELPHQAAPAEAAAAPGRPARGDQLAAARAAKTKTVASVIKGWGGLSEKGAEALGIDVKAAKESMPTIFQDKDGKKGTLDLEDLLHEAEKEGWIRDAKAPHAGEELLDYILNGAKVMDAGMDAADRRDELRYLQEKENALRQAQASGHPTAGSAEALQSGQAEGEQQGTDRSRTEEAADVHAEFTAPAAGGVAPAAGAAEPAGEPFPFGANEPGLGGAVGEFLAGEAGAHPLAYPFSILRSVGQKAAQYIDALKATFAPAARGKAAAEAAGSVRENNAELARKSEIAHEALKAGKVLFDRINVADRPVAFSTFVDAIEEGRIHDLPENVRPIAQAIRDLTDERTRQLLDRDLLHNFIENYFGHLWKRRGTPASDADSDAIGREFAARRPLTGPESYRKQRSIPSYKEGIDQGLEPRSWNPVELALLKIREMDRSIFGRDTFNELKENGLVKFFRLGESLPQGWQPFNDRLSTVFAPKAEGGAGPQLVGRYAAPEQVATLLNNHLSPGLQGNAIYDSFRGLGNLLNQFQLGFSAFHAGFVTMDTQVSAAALGLQQISRGEVFKGLGNILASPLAPIRAWLQGSKMLREYYNPGSQGAETAALMDALIKGGGRARMDAFYGSGHIEAFRNALADVRAGDPRKVGSLLWHALPALGEAVSYPIMNQLVPRMKLGVFADLARAEMARLGPAASPEESRQAFGRAWDSVENRLGQLTYDNVFWNRTLKDVLMAGVRSVGWNLGTIRELGGGLLDVTKGFRAGLTPRTGYLLALPMVAGLYGAIYQKLATGQNPDDLKDYFFPKTGRQRPDGTADRVALPSYIRDIAALSNRGDEGPLRWVQNAATMAKGKINPGAATVSEMLFNEDFHGAMIRNPNDTAVIQSRDTALHLLRSFESFSWRSFLEGRQGGATTPQALQGLVGVTPAPAYVTRTNVQQRAVEAKRKITLAPLYKKLQEEKRKK